MEAPLTETMDAMTTLQDFHTESFNIFKINTVTCYPSTFKLLVFLRELRVLRGKYFFIMLISLPIIINLFVVRFFI